MRLILASRSPARLATLKAAGIEPDVVVSDVDEDAVVAQSGASAPEDVSLLLARAKAEAVAAKLTGGHRPGEPLNAIVLGCDSVFFQDGTVHGKPLTETAARERLTAMSGTSGELHTGHWLIDLRDEEFGGQGGTVGANARTVVHVGTLSEDEIEAYLATGEPLNVAGSFTIDGLGGPFIEGVEGDHHNVVGLSLPVLRRLLNSIGLSITSLWKTNPRLGAAQRIEA